MDTVTIYNEMCEDYMMNEDDVSAESGCMCVGYVPETGASGAAVSSPPRSSPPLELSSILQLLSCLSISAFRRVGRRQSAP